MANILGRIAAVALIVNGTLVLIAGLVVVLPWWGNLGLGAIVAGFVLANLVQRKREETSRKIRSSWAYGPAEIAGALAEVKGIPAIDCEDCQKAISRDEWPAHVNWHRLAEGPPPSAQA